MFPGRSRWLPMTSGRFWSTLTAASGSYSSGPLEAYSKWPDTSFRSDQTLKAIRPGDPRKRTGRRRPVSASVRQQRIARLAIQLQLSRQAKDAVARDVSGDRSLHLPARKPKRRVRPWPRGSTRAIAQGRTRLPSSSAWDAEERVAKACRPSNSFETLARDWFEVVAVRLGAGLFAEDHRAARKGCLPVARSGCRRHHHAADAARGAATRSKPGASSKRRTERSRTAARSSAMASRSGRAQRIPAHGPEGGPEAAAARSTSRRSPTPGGSLNCCERATAMPRRTWSGPR